MYYVYILKSKKDNKLYIGQTSDLQERLSAHNRGSVKSTKNRKPLKLIYHEEFSTRSNAIKRESYLKRMKNSQYILALINKKSG
ncbi:MAG: GIY-YIG nuclease family protein [Candidatus Margulisbacteria bacterium]|nr:GIY-YIG nuclease family protein [Candidatus Margulisiibacteriota bacterium]MBU1021867.1 GIY-YIG nuclease family protein [Candidatus Margulisiibacteriota bacterium]MBU1729026.1 GIY-YIG nuclease family protein [Candidatus Margulisiibacteriota bacterium]